jgi:hypothetical protein
MAILENILFRNIILAVVLLAVGIVLGRIVSYVLKRLLDEAKIEKTKAYSFFKFFIVIIRWSTYILFLNIAIKQLEIPQVTDWIIGILIILPAVVGALILIVAGFVIASYLRNVIEESRIEGWEILSQIFYVFIIYVFLVFALKTALISMDSMIVNILLLILTAAFATAAVIHYSRKRR